MLKMLDPKVIMLQAQFLNRKKKKDVWRNSRGHPKTNRYNRPKPKNIPLKEMELAPVKRSSRLLQKSKKDDIQVLIIHL